MKKKLLDTEFYIDNQEIFNERRGYGNWLWKPYFILKAINEIPENEIVFYVDTGCKFISDPKPLIEIVRNAKSGIVAFDCYPLTNRQWTKRDTFINMSCDNEEFWNAPNVIATIVLFRKTSQVISFIEEWLKNCLNKDSLIEYHNETNNLPGFVEHREDQSIFSILIKKYNIETFRNPSLWGNFLKSPAFRNKNEFVGTPYLFDASIKDYSPNPYLNSPYGTIFEFNRKNKKSKITKFKQKVFDKVSLIKRSFRPFKKESYSISGEDLIVGYLFGKLGIQKIAYLEIEADYLNGISNTTLFYLNGSMGVNIQSDQVWFKQLKKIRKRDINLHLIIRKEHKEFDQKFAAKGDFSRKNDIDSLPLSKVICDYRHTIFPDYLSIFEKVFVLEILTSIDYTISCPKVISIQVKNLASKGEKIVDIESIKMFLENKGYYLYADINVSLIFLLVSYKANFK